MLPDGAHMRSEDWTILFLNQRIEDSEKTVTDNEDGNNTEEKPLLYVLNLVRTKHDVSARRYIISDSICYKKVTQC
jgi:hypothetical protein